MTSTTPLHHTLRQFLDVVMHHSMHERARFARAAGLSMPQFSILMQLHFCTQCGLSEISGRFDVSAAAASQLVDKLVQSGLVERSEDPHDRRAKQIQLSTKGRALIEKGLRERYRWVDQLVTQLEAKDREKVTAAVSLLSEAAQKLEQAQ
jgi:DNA-binding MarR family transcriptional regulator